MSLDEFNKVFHASDEFNKVTPASLTVKRTENLMPSAYTNLNLEAMPNVMANEGKQKKIIAPTQQ